MSDTCIVCGTNNNLNTQLTITVDDIKASISVCDTHSEDITPKIAKEKYLERKLQIDEFMARASELGLTFVQPNAESKLLIINNDKKPEATRQPVVNSEAEQPKYVDMVGDDVLSTDKVDKVAQSIHSINGTVNGSLIESHQAYNPESMLESKLKPGTRDGKVKMGSAVGRNGQIIGIPAVRRDGTGTTLVRVHQGVNDAFIQKRFKELAASNDGSGNNVHSFGHDGYQARECSSCNGHGVIRVKGRDDSICKRCNGTCIA
jgi:hypothetical protein